MAAELLFSGLKQGSWPSLRNGIDGLSVYRFRLIKAECKAFGRCRGQSAKKCSRRAENTCDPRAVRPISGPAQFRTCLWLRAGWWASGQEAGQPPESVLALDTPNRQPEAKPAYPALNGGRDLKQRRTGFFGLVGPPKVNTEEACLSLPRVRTGTSLSNPRQHRRVKSPLHLRVSIARSRNAIFPADAGRLCLRGPTSELQSGGARPPLSLWWESADDRSVSANSCATDVRTDLASSSTSTSCATTTAKFAQALPDTRVFYAVKANPGAGGPQLLADLGSCFDTASVAEIEMALAAGATPDRISFGNTIKKERDIARAFALGVRLFAVDCEAEVEKIAARRAGVALGRAGVLPHPVRRRRRRMAAVAQVRLRARDGGRTCSSTPSRLGLEAYGVSFHVGSQQRNTDAWDQALASASAIFRECADARHPPVDGQSRRRLPDPVPEGRAGREAYGESIFRALRSISATASRRRSSSRAAAWSAMPASSRPRSCSSRRRARTRTRCAGSISTSASSAVSPRRWTSRSATRSAPSTMTTARSRACSPARPATRPTSLREGALPAPRLAGDRRQGADRRHGRLHDHLFGGRVQRLPAA